mmetsp:Transcript_107416/g.333802  ORF Transcript_107416/g.333802 Transcript_107416/m.333802 type:complete len:720 (+) Transcript_107416:183-2342(+)
MYFKKGDKPASKPAPCVARSSGDVDDFGWPKAPIEGEDDVPEEKLREYERRRKEILESRPAREFPKPLQKKPVPLTSHMTQEEFDALDYPKVPEEWNEEWMKKQIELERVDPRENPNLLFDECQQEFWFNSARKPYAKAILRSEQHWTNRRNVWLKQYETVENMNQLRESVAEELEDCSMEVKRLVTPIMHHKITELALKSYVREASEHQISLSQLLQDPTKLKELQGLRSQIDRGGDAAAAGMLEFYTAMVSRCCEDRKKEKDEAERGKRIVSDTDSMAKILNMGQKCKKDGHLEWHKDNFAEALSSWRLADTYLKRYKLPDDDKTGNKMIADLHITILKNLAQAALKLGYFTEALDAADDALRIDDQDHKAWFRRACALEGLGRYEEEEQALEKIDELAVGRPDRARIQKDLDSRRAKLQSLSDQDARVQRKGFARALARGVFSEEREAKPLEPAPKAALADQPGSEAAPAEEPTAEQEAAQGAPAGAPASPFQAGDAVVVRKTIADLPRGLRGTVVEVDGDGDVRIQFEGHEDIEMLLGEDLEHLAKDTGEELSPEEEEELPACEDQPAAGAQQQQAAPARKHLTKDSAAELLEELRHAYEDTAFRKQVAKLARDMRWDKGQFVLHLRKVALEVQRPALEKWGFEASQAGVAEVELALLAHTRGAPGTGEGRDAALKEKADAVTRLLYGEMYEAVFLGGFAGPPPRPAQAEDALDE